jgi:putative transposase
MPGHPDLGDRDFTAIGPNQLWVTDLTFVPTWAGIAHVCFIIDAFSRMIVGCRVASHSAPRWSTTPLRWPGGPAGPSWPD